MTTKELDAIRQFIVWKVARNINVMYDEIIVDNETDLTATDVIFALYEALHTVVTGENYDYMWHWTNKIGCSTEHEPKILQDIIERGKEL